MPDDDNSGEAIDDGTDISCGLLETVPSGEGDIYATRWDRTGDGGNRDVSGMARSDGPSDSSNVKYERRICKSENAVVRRFLTEVGLKPDKVGDS